MATVIYSILTTTNASKCHPLAPAISIEIRQSEFLKATSFNAVKAVNFHQSGFSRRTSIQAKAADTNQRSKPNSIVCVDCEGNGVVLCSQCKGSGVNSVDHFNGRFKAGGLCWLCRGKKEILCGNCNGAGFVGGFMSTQDD